MYILTCIHISASQYNTAVCVPKKVFIYCRVSTYVASHGTQKGIQFKYLLCGLVLLVHGTTEEKTKCKLNHLLDIVCSFA